MDNSVKVIEENLTMSGILRWLEDKYGKKKTGKPFNIQDVQGYVRRDRLPYNYGGYEIRSTNKYNKLYNLIES